MINDPVYQFCNFLFRISNIKYIRRHLSRKKKLKFPIQELCNAYELFIDLLLEKKKSRYQISLSFNNFSINVLLSK